MTRRIRRQRSQSMVEFAAIAPLLLLLAFGIVDLGRAVFAYVSIRQAVADGARAAAAYTHPLPNNATVAAAVQNHQVTVQLATSCPNGPLSTSAPPANTGWIYITQPNPSTSAMTTTPGPPYTAPGSQTVPPANPPTGCSAVNPATADAELQVTIIYNFVPLTPVISQLVANHAILQASTVFRTEY